MTLRIDTGCRHIFTYGIVQPLLMVDSPAELVEALPPEHWRACRECGRLERQNRDGTWTTQTT